MEKACINYMGARRAGENDQQNVIIYIRPIVLSIWCLEDADLRVINIYTYLYWILRNMSSIGVLILGNFHCFKIEPIMVIIEYVPYGDLLGYLRKSRGLNDTYYKDPDVKPNTNLTSQQLIKFAWQVADGMEYLSNKKVG